MSFFLFILVTATLLIRPAEIVPALLDQPLYEVLVLVCFAACCPAVLRQLTPGSLAANPVTACVVGYLGVIFLSGLWNFGPGQAYADGFTFFKVLMYYLLLVATVDSPNRLRAFLYALAGFIMVLTVLALLQYHGAIHIQALASYAERQQDQIDTATGEQGRVLLRLCSTGIFHNPNDLARVLVVGIIVSLFCLADWRGSLLRLLWLAPVGLFSYGLLLTHSRGGFLTLMGSLSILVCERIGKWKAAWIALLALPLLLVLFSGRQTDLSIREGTGQQRIKLWNEGLKAVREHPALGIGMDQFAEQLGAGLGAHNSFVHSYTELGLLGGTLFLGIFVASMVVLHRVGSCQLQLPDDTLRRARPYLLAIVGGYAVGMLSSTRCYSPPTYLLFGLAAVHGRLASAFLSAPLLRFDRRLVRTLVAASAAALGALYVFTRLFSHYG